MYSYINNDLIIHFQLISSISHFINLIWLIILIISFFFFFYWNKF